MANVWQIASGAEGRDYSDLFLEHDLMFLGDGSFGNYYENKKEYTKCKLHNVIRFVEEVKPGDKVILRLGTRVIDVGLIDDEDFDKNYRYDTKFDDVYGWNLEHTRRVIWGGNKKYFEGLQKNTKDNLLYGKRLSTFSRINIDLPKEITNKLSQLQKRNLKDLPSEVPDLLTLEEVGEELFSKGLPNESVDKLIALIQKQRRLSKWYNKYGQKSDRPTEHEIVAHMILPMLIALGWSEQLMAIEWKHKDLAVFGKTPTNESNCLFICEAKGLWSGLQDGVYEQAKRYAEEIRSKQDNPKKCNMFILAEGTRIYLYRNINNKWETVPSGYINFNKLRRDHITPRGTNAIDTIMSLTPFGVLSK